MVCQVGSQSAIEIGIASLEVCSETTVLHWQVVIFFLIHLLVDNILLGNTKRATSTALVDLTGTSGTLDTSLQAAVTSARSGNVSSGMKSVVIREQIQLRNEPLLVLLMSPLGLERLGSGHGSDWRHCCVVEKKCDRVYVVGMCDKKGW